MTRPRLLRAGLLVGVVLCGVQIAPHAGCDGRSLTFGVELSGDEILVEMEQIGPGSDPPGIYAITTEAELKRLITFGKDPRWAPSRTKFAYQLRGELWIVDLERRRRVLVSEVAGRHYDAPHSVLSRFVASATEWLPDEAGLVRWARWPAEHAQMKRVPQIVPLGSDSGYERGGPLIPPGSHDVGRISFSPDGNSVAYEQFDAVPDLGLLDPQVFILDRETGESRRVVVPGYEDHTLLNPLWAPVGRRLAVDCIGPDRERHVVIYDLERQSAARLPAPWEIWEWERVPSGRLWAQGLAWSPDGTRLIAADDGRWGAAGYLFEAIPGEPIRYVRLANSTASLFAVSWSRSGDEVAALEAQAELAACYPSAVGILITSAHAGVDSRWIRLPEHLRPVRIDW